MRKSLSTAIYICDSLAVVRYPRGGDLYKPDDFGEENLSYDVYGNPNCKNLLITYGRLFSYACKAKETLAKQGVEICILKLCRIKPIDENAVDFAAALKRESKTEALHETFPICSVALHSAEIIT